MNWRLRAPCHRLPSYWWETGDDGNRLAMTICRIACPVRAECATADPEPTGIVHLGVAYNDRGRACPTCPCGRPVVRRSTQRDRCWTCAPTAVHIRLRKPGRPRKPAAIA